jgi:LysR family cys regulon transcriptional activator
MCYPSHGCVATPKVEISLHQGSPDQVAKMVIDEIAE